MKKLFYAATLLLGMVLMMGTAKAQDYPKSIVGVSVGLNVSNITSEEMDMDSKIGFHIAGSYELLLTKNVPFYLETGLQLSQKGGSLMGMSMKAWYAEIPLMLNYKFALPYELTVSPAVGAYYGFGLTGQAKGWGEKVDLFDKDDGWNRSDFGIRAGVTAQWHKVALGLGYEFGMFDFTDGGEVSMRNFFVSVGIRF